MRRHVTGEDPGLRQHVFQERLLVEKTRELLRIAKEVDDLVGRQVQHQAGQDDAAARIRHRKIKMRQDLMSCLAGKQIRQGDSLDNRPGTAAIE